MFKLSPIKDIKRKKGKKLKFMFFFKKKKEAKK